MRIALLQTVPQKHGLQSALKTLEDAARRSSRRGVDVLVTPEMFLSGYAIGPEQTRAAAMPRNGESMRYIAGLARQLDIALVVGFPERGEDGHIYNAAQVIDRSGETLTVYRKSHLWGDIDRAQFSRGETLSDVVTLGQWRVGFAICYDIEFPEVARSLALDGAEMILVPTASMKPYQSIATQVVPARAEENEIAVAYCNYLGNEGDIDYFGHSRVALWDGKIAQDRGGQEDLICVDLDRDAFEHWSSGNNHRADRRPELYGRLI